MGRRSKKSYRRAKKSARCKSAVRQFAATTKVCAIKIQAAQRKIPQSCYFGVKNRRTRGISRRISPTRDDMIEGGFISAGASEFANLSEQSV